MGDGGEGNDKGRSKSLGTGNDVQGGGSDSVSIWELEMGGDGSNVDGSRAFSSLGGQTNCGKDSLACWGWWVVMATSGRIPVGFRYVAYQRMHS